MRSVICREDEIGIREKEFVSVTELMVYLFLLDV